MNEISGKARIGCFSSPKCKCGSASAEANKIAKSESEKL